jgi:hypothetical protein
MKSVMEFLEEQKSMAIFQCYHFSTSANLDTAKPGYEKEYKEAIRDRDIIAEIMAMVLEKNV